MDHSGIFAGLLIFMETNQIYFNLFSFPNSVVFLLHYQEIKPKFKVCNVFQSVWNLPVISVYCVLNLLLILQELTLTSLSLLVFFSCGLFQMWTSVLKKAIAARVVPILKGGSSAGAFRAMSYGLTSAAAKLWVKIYPLCFSRETQFVP